MHILGDYISKAITNSDFKLQNLLWVLQIHWMIKAVVGVSLAVSVMRDRANVC